MKEESNEEVGGFEYKFTQMQPEDAVRVALRIMKVAGLQVGGAIGSLQFKPGGEQTMDNLKIDTELLGVSIGKMLGEIDEEESIDTINKLLNCVWCNGKAMTMNHPNFQSGTLHLFQVAIKSGRVNFNDFFDASSGVVDVLKKLATTIMEKATSTGLTGDSSSAA